MKITLEYIIKHILKFLEPLPVMWYLFFIGLLLGTETILGLILCFIGGFFGSLLLKERLEQTKYA